MLPQIVIEQFRRNLIKSNVRQFCEKQFKIHHVESFAVIQGNQNSGTSFTIGTKIIINRAVLLLCPWRKPDCSNIALLSKYSTNCETFLESLYKNAKDIIATSGNYCEYYFQAKIL